MEEDKTLEDKTSDFLINEKNKKNGERITPTGESCLYFLVRHAERNDNEAPGELKVKDDPTITEYGKHQASETAREIKKMIENYKKEGLVDKDAKVIVLTSPFLRCIQSAYHIAQYFGKKANETIYIEDGLIEWQKDFNNMIDEKHQKLAYDHMKPETIKRFFNGKNSFERNAIFDYKTQQCLQRAVYENNEQIRNRYVAIMENLVDLAIKNKPKYVYVCVVHATMTEWVMKSIDGGRDKSENSSINVIFTETYQENSDSSKTTYLKKLMAKNVVAYKDKKYYEPNLKQSVEGTFLQRLCGTAFCRLKC